VKIEHVAYQVADPVGLAEWYVEHLGMTVKRSQSTAPFGHFLADDGDAVMLEFYHHPRVPVPDYRETDPLALHLAFQTDDVSHVRDRLIAAGATPEGDVQVTDAGDHVAMLRDPSGLALQLVQRAAPMIPR
jgi:glyoxylase I family protein